MPITAPPRYPALRDRGPRLARTSAMPNPFDVLFAPATPRITARVRTVKLGCTVGPCPEPYAERVKRQRERDNERSRDVRAARVRAGR